MSSSLAFNQKIYNLLNQYRDTRREGSQQCQEDEALVRWSGNSDEENILVSDVFQFDNI